MDLNKIINLEKYPINDIGSLKYKELTNYTRKQVYGKALPIHFERENIQGDGLTD